jgi:hypothetical protein
MLKVMYNVIFLLALLTITPQTIAKKLDFGPKTILVYQTESGEEKRQFVLRIARFKPDVVLEWESLSHQGTVHIFKKAVQEASQFSVNDLFEIGMDVESSKATTKWLSRKVYEELLEKGGSKIKLNRISAKFELKEESTRQVSVNKVVTEVPVIIVTDSRNGVWAFLKDPDNPIVIEYQTPYYYESLARISTDEKNQLRWIKKLPPIR